MHWYVLKANVTKLNIHFSGPYSMSVDPKKTNMRSLGHLEVLHMGLQSWVARKNRDILGEKTVPIQSTVALDWVDIFT